MWRTVSFVVAGLVTLGLTIIGVQNTFWGVVLLAAGAFVWLAANKRFRIWLDGGDPFAKENEQPTNQVAQSFSGTNFGKIVGAEYHAPAPVHPPIGRAYFQPRGIDLDKLILTFWNISATMPARVLHSGGRAYLRDALTDEIQNELIADFEAWKTQELQHPIEVLVPGKDKLAIGLNTNAMKSITKDDVLAIRTRKKYLFFVAFIRFRDEVGEREFHMFQFLHFPLGQNQIGGGLCNIYNEHLEVTPQ